MKKILLAAVLAALLFAYSTALSQERVVVTSFYPIYILTRNLTVGIDDISVQNLAAPDTGCLHDYQLLTGDMRTLASAQVFLINGAGMESYLDAVTAQFKNLQVVDASTGIPLLDTMGENEHSHEEGEDGHDHEDNAHIWLDVENAKAMVENLRDGLINAFPQDKDNFALNAQAYLERLNALNEELTAGLANLPNKEIITFHEAFPYFAKAYGLHVAAVVYREPGEALSPAQLADLVSLVQALGTPPLFTEPQYPDLAARTLAAETGAKVYELNPMVTGPMDEGALYAYEDGMRKNMQVLIQALGGM